MRRKKILIATLILLFIASLSAISFKPKKEQSPSFSSPKEAGLPNDGEKIKLLIENVEFEAEVVKSPAARARGLGGRTDLCPQCGMLFIFETDNYHAFWMKGTLIPLDIIWLDKNWQVVDFTAFAQPQAGRPDEELPVYRPKTPARYVLELPGGTVEKIRGFKIGSRVELER